MRMTGVIGMIRMTAIMPFVRPPAAPAAAAAAADAPPLIT